MPPLPEPTPGRPSPQSIELPPPQLQRDTRKVLRPTDPANARSRAIGRQRLEPTQVIARGIASASRRSRRAIDDMGGVADELEWTLGRARGDCVRLDQRQPFGVAVCALPLVVDETGTPSRDHGDLDAPGIRAGTAIEEYAEPPTGLHGNRCSTSPVGRVMDTKPDLPPDNGERPSIDKKGQVHGSGVGNGGGQPGEDMASGRAGGDGYPLTGTDDAPTRD